MGRGGERDEFDRAGADRIGAHLARADMTRIDRRPARGEECDERGLRPLQVKRDLVVAVRGHLFEVAVPGFARIDAQLFARLAGNQVPGAFDVGRSERLAVVPEQFAARSGTIDARLFWGTFWSN